MIKIPNRPELVLAPESEETRRHERRKARIRNFTIAIQHASGENHQHINGGCDTSATWWSTHKCFLIITTVQYRGMDTAAKPCPCLCCCTYSIPLGLLHVSYQYMHAFLHPIGTATSIKCGN